MNGKVGIVTGGASGIGYAVVQRLLQSSAHVYMIDRDIVAVDRINRECAGLPLIAVAGDITDPEAAENLVTRCVAEKGRIDYLANIAGTIHPLGHLTDLSCDDLDHMHAVNVKGTFLFYKAAVRAMIDKDTAGSIVNVSSVAGIRPGALAGGYVASKHAVVGLTLTGALETAAKGIRVNVVCPGVTDTPLTREKGGVAADAMKLAIPMQRMGEPEELAAAIVWLLSDDASYVTGAILSVDGGVSLV